MRVLISGYGIMGKVMAGIFSQVGICPDIIERSEKEGLKEGTGLALPANADWALHKLGFEKELQERAHRVENMSFSKPGWENSYNAMYFKTGSFSKNFIGFIESIFEVLLGVDPWR